MTRGLITGGRDVRPGKQGTNSERPTLNIERRTDLLPPLPLPLLGRLGAAHKNTDQLIGLLYQRLHQAGPQQRHPLDQEQPAPGLSQLLEADLELVHKVLGRLSGLRLAVVRQRRRARPQQLAGDVVARAGVRQPLHQPDNPRRVFQQPLLQIVISIQSPLHFPGFEVRRSMFAFFLLALNAWFCMEAAIPWRTARSERKPRTSWPPNSAVGRLRTKA